MTIALIMAAAWMGAEDIPTLALVTLENVRIEKEHRVEPPVLSIYFDAQNLSGHSIQSVDVGIRVAEDHQGLVKGDPYFSKSLKEAVGVLSFRVFLNLPPMGRDTVRTQISLPKEWPVSRVFDAYVLSYGIEHLSLSEMFTLLHTNAAADEAAAVHTFALAGDVQARQFARHKFGQNPELRTELLNKLGESPTLRVSQDFTADKLFTLLVLGVLGGTGVEQALMRFEEQPWFNDLEEPLQIFRIARLGGSYYETPLAFALPASVRSVRELTSWVASNVRDLQGIDSEPEILEVDGAMSQFVETPPMTPVPTPRFSWRVAFGVGFGVFLMLWLVRFIRQR